jgi:hypothetical protein
MKALSRTAAALVTVALAAPCWAGEVKIEIRGGLVTLSAKDASVREVLNEWSRVGQTRIVNAERVPGGLLNLELNGVPEAKALDIVLRSVAGYVAAPRRASTPAAESRFDRIVIMAIARPAGGGSAPTSTVSTPPPANFQRGRVGGYPPQPQAQPSLMVDDQDEPVQPEPQPVPPMTGSPSAPQPGMPTAPPGLPVAPGQAPPQATPFPPGQQPNSPAATRPGVMTPPVTPVQKPPGGPGGN